MTLPFFRALNPGSHNSGIEYPVTQGYQGRYETFEMQDNTVCEHIREVWDKNLGLLDGIIATWNVLLGDHFDLNIKGTGQKAALDYFIFPLVARKLMADASVNFQHNRLAAYPAYMTALPLEALRFAAAFTLTIALLPVIATVHFFRTFAEIFKACFDQSDEYIEIRDIDLERYDTGNKFHTFVR